MEIMNLIVLKCFKCLPHPITLWFNLLRRKFSFTFHLFHHVKPLKLLPVCSSYTHTYRIHSCRNIWKLFCFLCEPKLRNIANDSIRCACVHVYVEECEWVFKKEKREKNIQRENGEKKRRDEQTENVAWGSRCETVRFWQRIKLAWQQ